MSLFLGSALQMTLYGNPHTPVGKVTTACATAVVLFTRKHDTLLSERKYIIERAYFILSLSHY